MDVNANLVKELREISGSGFMDCKAALVATNGDLEAAADFLRKKGVSSAAKKSHRSTGEGLVESYIHPGGKVGRAHRGQLRDRLRGPHRRLQDARARPGDADRRRLPDRREPEEVPAELVAKEREILTEQAKASGKPEKIIEKMVEGRIQKYYEEVCLLEQKFVKEQDRAVREIVNDAIAKLGENIRVRRFARFQLGK